MVTLDVIRTDLLAARKARDEVAVGVLNPLLGEAAKKGKDDGNREATPAEVNATVKKFLDGAREILGHLTKPGGGKPGEADAKARVEREIAILEGYMPKQLTDDELREAILGVRRDNPGAQMKQFMAFLKGSYPGRYDGRRANALVGEILAGR